MSDLVGPLLPGMNILVQPIGEDVARPLVIGVADDGMQLSRWITKANHVKADQQAEIARLQEELKVAKWLLGHLPIRPVAVTETDTGRNPAPENTVRERVDAVISDLAGRKVADADRARLRGAVDKADRPLAGREGSDAAVGKALGRSVTIGLRASIL